MTEDETADIVDAFEKHIELEVAGEYLHRGRRFRNLDDAALEPAWLAAMTALAERITEERVREMTDLGAELRLRDREPPTDQAAAAFEALTQRMGDEFIRRNLRKALVDFVSPPEDGMH